VRRVYIVERARLNHHGFFGTLTTLVNKQRDMGVEVGLQILDSLPESCRQDFILFNQTVVLVEERQANSDYTLAKSTAYFRRDAIRKYKELFDTVWKGRASGTNPVDFARSMFPTKYESGTGEQSPSRSAGGTQ
jgi:hypothetical protein